MKPPKPTADLPIISIRQLTDYLETIAPPSYQESYDNTGLLVGNPNTACTSALLCLDATEAVIAEAVEKSCNLVVAHHPIVFGGLKKLNGKNYVERAVLAAIKNDIAIYAIHTNLDNVRTGVNRKIADRLGLQQCRVLQPRTRTLKKLSTLCPIEHADRLRDALLPVVQGWQNDVANVAFSTIGVSTFAPTNNSVAEVRLDIVFAAHLERPLLAAMRQYHPHPNPNYELTTLEQSSEQIGSGMIGDLPQAMPIAEFWAHLKTAMQAECIRHTAPIAETVSRIAICGGTGISLLPDAIRQQADVLVTADVKYHQFFDADQQIVIADIGHYETEHFTAQLLHSIISEKFPTFAAQLSEVRTNPVGYV
ncbi:MAG: Nif3-like dinuclear metal center hexameric protein [Sphingobacteriales bacterium]|nr:Nif3-like dinuclear metal center hexameric protein [Sphingobacteriales bacterium]MCC7222233.1 Nif3-like dinuclear metal center hexameric protein [Chitinophagales bacterium]